MMYLKDGENGFIVEPGNVQALANKLMLLLDNDYLRKKFSEAAKREISTNGHIDKLCAGFRDALQFAIGPKKTRPVPFSEANNGGAGRVVTSELR
jgi:hypothetical protein